MNDVTKQYVDSLKAMQTEIDKARKVCQSMREVDQDISNLRRLSFVEAKKRTFSKYGETLRRLGGRNGT